jgi:hypothetical protein
LPEAYRGPLLTLYAELDALEEVRSDAEKALVQEARKFPITKLLATCPGLGAIRAAQLVPIVVSPHRFRTKRQFWSYCGLGIVMRSTSDWLPDPPGTSTSVPVSFGKAKSFRDDDARTRPRSRGCDSLLLLA